VELKLNVAKWRRRRGMARLLDAMGAGEGLTRYVGGAVRDELLGLPVSDVDLATKLRPEEVLERLEAAGIRAIPTGIDHGTVTAVSQGHAVEITSLRRDVSTDGRRATVAFTDDWKQDAARRDFTINALSADPATGEIHDYFGGVDDLRTRHVRFIGDPLERIAEDHLRILRFFRFHARFGAGEPDADALAACAARANDLMALSRERIADEILKLLSVEDPVPTVAIMLRHGILAPVLPEIGPVADKDLAALVAAEQESATKPEPLRRLSALLPADPELADRIASRLRLSNRARRRLACAATRDCGASPQALAYYVGKECAVDRLLLCGRSRDAASLRSWHAPHLPIRGGTLIEQGLPPGPQVARTLHAIEREWVERGFPEGSELDEIVAAAMGRADQAKKG